MIFSCFPIYEFVRYYFAFQCWQWSVFEDLAFAKQEHSSENVKKTSQLCEIGALAKISCTSVFQPIPLTTRKYVSLGSLICKCIHRRECCISDQFMLIRCCSLNVFLERYLCLS
ncbi:hypothetical protein AMTRI_Chr11g157240 [Amborella trichopoda]